MKILVTGGAGFIGSFVAKKLADRGDEVVIVDNLNAYYDPKLKKDRLGFLSSYDNIEINELDIANYKDLEKIFTKHSFDKICHLAAQAGVRYSLENPQVYIDSNIVGTHNIFELARQFKVNDVVFASSSSVYGGNKKIPFSEEDKVDNPISLYAATKKSNELEAYTYHHLFGLNVFGLRFFTVYGPWGRPDMALFKFTKAISQDQPIDVYNQGKMRRDFTYIDDIVEGVVLSLDKVKDYEVINLGNHNPVELEEFISVIEEYVGKKANKNYMPLQPGDVIETYADTKKAKELLGWEPKTNINEGVKKFVEWYKSYYKL